MNSTNSYIVSGVIGLAALALGYKLLDEKRSRHS